MNNECICRLRHRLVYSVGRVDTAYTDTATPIICDPRRLLFCRPWHPRSYPAGCRILQIPIHGDIPSSRSILQVSYGFPSPLLLSERIPRLVQRLVLKHLVDDANYKRVVDVVLLNDVLLYDVPSYTVRPVIYYNPRPIRHGYVYIFQRVTWGIKGYVTLLLKYCFGFLKISKFTIVSYREIKKPQLPGKVTWSNRRANHGDIWASGWVFSTYRLLSTVKCLRSFWGHWVHFWFSTIFYLENGWSQSETNEIWTSWTSIQCIPHTCEVKCFG